MLGAAVPALAVTALLVFPLADKAKPKPLCLGKRATIVGTGSADEINGTRKGDVIHGLGAADRINGGGGNDLICGGPGSDELDGGAGRDRLDGGAAYDFCHRAESRRGCEETRPAPRAGALAPGEYATSRFQPRFRFALPVAGWSTRFGEQPQHFDMARRRDPGGLVLGFDSGPARDSVAATVARIAAKAAFRTTPPVAGGVGGAAGLQLDVTVVSEDVAGLGATVPGFSEDYFLELTDRARIFVVDVRGRTLTVVVEAPDREFDSFLPEAQRVLDSVRFT